MARCPSCGMENSPEAAFCLSCGAPLVQAPGPGGGEAAEKPTIGYVFGAPDEKTVLLTGAQETGGEAPSPPGGAEPEPPQEIKPQEEEEIKEEPEPEEPEEAEEVGYYLPPEADYHKPAPKLESPPPERPPQAEESVSVSRDRTQAMAPVVAAGAAAARPGKVVCPECYAPNPENNLYCQECGSALPTTTGSRKAAAVSQAPGPAAYRRTTVLPAQEAAGAGETLYAAPSRERGSKWAESFGVADILVLLSTLVVAVTLVLTLIYVDSFPYLKGSDVSIFSHQGYAVGSREVLGGPGFLPYAGWEFFTVGMMAALGIGLAVIFLLVRVGRGPMYLLAGCILLFPLFYLFFQAVLPLKGAGITPESSVGLKAMFFGGVDFEGLGYPIWFISGAGLLVLVAGFLAPPRGWGRLFTLTIFLGLALGLAFLGAVTYNWGLFIEQPAAASSAAAYLPSAAAGLPVLLC